MHTTWTKEPNCFCDHRIAHKLIMRVLVCLTTNSHKEHMRTINRLIILFVYLFQLKKYFNYVKLQHSMSLPPPTTLTSMHASLPHFLPSPALASPVGSQSSQPGMGVSNPPCSTLFVANLGQFVSEHELKEIFARWVDYLVGYSKLFTCFTQILTL